MEHKCRERGIPLDDAWEGEMENEERASYQTTWAIGTGERHWEWIPTNPDKDSKDLSWEEYIARCEEVSVKNGQVNFQEFVERLDFNLGRVGKGLQRGPRKFYGYAPKPAEGYSLVVT
jgi:hypothetical protein